MVLFMGARSAYTVCTCYMTIVENGKTTLIGGQIDEERKQYHEADNLLHRNMDRYGETF